jgi:hypothetical protein
LAGFPWGPLPTNVVGHPIYDNEQRSPLKAFFVRFVAGTARIYKVLPPSFRLPAAACWFHSYLGKVVCTFKHGVKDDEGASINGASHKRISHFIQPRLAKFLAQAADSTTNRNVFHLRTVPDIT